MTFIEQMEWNNHPNHPDQIKARELMQGMKAFEPAESVRVIETDTFGHPVKQVTDEDGETWIQFFTDI